MTTLPFSIGNLEMHAWHGCNLSCDSCSHYSSVGLHGGPTPDECREWMDSWSARLVPAQFSILGGEPAANRYLTEIVTLAVERWPNSEIRLVTNGLLLHRHPKLPVALARARSHVLVLSSHHASVSYQRQLEPVRQLLKQWAARHALNYRIVEAETFWTRRYHADTSTVRFFDSDSRQAWSVCVGKHCVQLYDRRLWKCPPVAYFDLVANSRTVDDDSLRRRNTYRPLDPSCDDSALSSFLTLEDEPICALCPERPLSFALANPLPVRRR